MKRFGKPRVIAKEHTKKLLESPCVHTNNVSMLRKQLDSWEAHVRSLKEMQLDPTSNPISNSVFLTVFEEKVPSEILRRWELRCHERSDEEITIDAFFTFLGVEVEASEAKAIAEESNRVKEDSRKKEYHRLDEDIKHEDNQSVVATWTSTSSVQVVLEEPSRETTTDTVKWSAPSVKRNHHVELCCEKIKGMNSQDLLNKIFERRICLRCLSKQSHFARDCKTNSVIIIIVVIIIASIKIILYVIIIASIKNYSLCNNYCINKKLFSM